MSRVRAHVVVAGRVQGVWFRASTRDMAREFGLDGWVQNRSDGGVEAVFEGTRESVERAAEWCRTGPSGARVDHCDVIWEDPRGEAAFAIRYP